MTLDEAASILEIEPTASASAARRAYLRKLKLHKPERDPDAFMRIRAAYDCFASSAGSDRLLAALVQLRDEARAREASAPGAPAPPAGAPVASSAPPPSPAPPVPEPPTGEPLPPELQRFLELGSKVNLAEMYDRVMAIEAHGRMFARYGQRSRVIDALTAALSAAQLDPSLVQSPSLFPRAMERILDLLAEAHIRRPVALHRALEAYADDPAGTDPPRSHELRWLYVSELCHLAHDLPPRSLERLAAALRADSLPAACDVFTDRDVSVVFTHARRAAQAPLLCAMHAQLVNAEMRASLARDCAQRRSSARWPMSAKAWAVLAYFGLAAFCMLIGECLGHSTPATSTLPTVDPVSTVLHVPTQQELDDRAFRILANPSSSDEERRKVTEHFAARGILDHCKRLAAAGRLDAGCSWMTPFMTDDGGVTTQFTMGRSPAPTGSNRP